MQYSRKNISIKKEKFVESFHKKPDKVKQPSDDWRQVRSAKAVLEKERRSLVSQLTAIKKEISKKNALLEKLFKEFLSQKQFIESLSFPEHINTQKPELVDLLNTKHDILQSEKGQLYSLNYEYKKRTTVEKKNKELINQVQKGKQELEKRNQIIENLKKQIIDIQYFMNNLQPYYSKDSWKFMLSQVSLSFCKQSLKASLHEMEQTQEDVSFTQNSQSGDSSGSSDLLCQSGMLLHEMEQTQEDVFFAQNSQSGDSSGSSDLLCQSGMLLHAKEQIQEDVSFAQNSQSGDSSGSSDLLCQSGMLLHEMEQIQEDVSFAQNSQSGDSSGSDLLCQSGMLLHEMEQTQEDVSLQLLVQIPLQVLKSLKREDSFQSDSLLQSGELLQVSTLMYIKEVLVVNNNKCTLYSMTPLYQQVYDIYYIDKIQYYYSLYCNYQTVNNLRSTELQDFLICFYIYHIFNVCIIYSNISKPHTIYCIYNYLWRQLISYIECNMDRAILKKLYTYINTTINNLDIILHKKEAFYTSYNQLIAIESQDSQDLQLLKSLLHTQGKELVDCYNLILYAVQNHLHFFIAQTSISSELSEFSWSALTIEDIPTIMQSISQEKFLTFFADYEPVVANDIDDMNRPPQQFSQVDGFCNASLSDFPIHKSNVIQEVSPSITVNTTLLREVTVSSAPKSSIHSLE